MNNSLIAMESVSLAEDKEQVDISVLRAKETELIAVIEAIVHLSVNPDWITLKEKVFDGVVNSLVKKRDSQVDVIDKSLNGPAIHSLNGQIRWAKKYSNILDLAHIYKLELTNIRKQINGREKGNNRDDS